MRRKLCGQCLRIKDITEFISDVEHSNGTASACRECMNAYARKRRKLIRENKWPPTKPIGIMQKWEKRDGEGNSNRVKLPPAPEHVDKATQDRCSRKVKRAIALGQIAPPVKCSLCGQSPDIVGKLVAHHVDYSKPLSVVFLCKSCHSITHKADRRKGNAVMKLPPPSRCCMNGLKHS